MGRSDEEVDRRLDAIIEVSVKDVIDEMLNRCARSGMLERLGVVAFAFFCDQVHRTLEGREHAAFAVGMIWGVSDRIASGELDSMQVLVLVDAMAKGESAETLEKIAVDVGVWKRDAKAQR